MIYTMSIISQNNINEVAFVDCIQRLFSKHKVGKILKECNSTKEMGVPSISILKYKLGNIFIGCSMYMQQHTDSFKDRFSNNTFYLLNSAKTNCLRFTSLLVADIVNHDLENLTGNDRTNVFIVDGSLFNRSSCKKTKLGFCVFDHMDMSYKRDTICTR